MSKGSKKRPRKISVKQFENNWDAIFGSVKARKKTPKHGVSKVHRDKTKYDRSKAKTEWSVNDS